MNEDWRLIFFMFFVITACGCMNRDQGFDNVQGAHLLITDGTYYLNNENASNSILEIMSNESGVCNYRLTILGTVSNTYKTSLEGDIEILDGKAIIRTNEVEGTCAIKIQSLDSLTIQLETIEGDSNTCRAGGEIIPIGIYRLQKETKSALGLIDPTQMIGIWRNIKDPTFEIKIDEEEYIEYNRGQKVNSMKYKVSADYSDACSQNSSSSCLTVWGDTDTFCFSIIHADIKLLELSMMGGVGPSLQFERLK